MKKLKLLRELLIPNNDIYDFLLNLKIVDKNKIPVDFREQKNSERGENSFLFETSKNHFMNNVVQNTVCYVYNEDKKQLDNLKKLPYEDRKSLASRVMNDSYSIMLRSFITFLQEGQRVVSIKNKELFEQFENTSIKNLNFQDLQIFLDSFYLSIEKTICGVYVDGMFFENEKDCFNITLLLKRQGDKSNEVLIGALYKHNDIETAIKVSIDELGFHCGSKLLECEDAQLREVLKRRFEKESFEDAEILKYTYKLLVNVLMFFGTVKTKEYPFYEIKEEDKRVPVSSSSKKDKYSASKVANSNYYYYLSSNSKQNHEFKLSENHRKINKMFVVTGHYRKQPIGIRENPEHKIIWIEPFLKGISGAIDNKLRTTII